MDELFPTPKWRAFLNNIYRCLDYIYNGEIQIYQENLDRFLKIAQRLKLEGLLRDNNLKDKEEIVEYEPPPKLKIPFEVFNSENDFQENSKHLENQLQLLDPVDHTELDKTLYENMENNSDGTYSCKLCSKVAKLKTNMKFHIETHLTGLSFPCNICGKNYRSRNSLRMHTSNYHKLN